MVMGAGRQVMWRWFWAGERTGPLAEVHRTRTKRVVSLTGMAEFDPNRLLGEVTGCKHRDYNVVGRQSLIYSITSSAMASNPAGTSMPSVRAVCRLMMNSNFVGRT